MWVPGRKKSRCPNSLVTERAASSARKDQLGAEASARVMAQAYRGSPSGPRLVTAPSACAAREGAQCPHSS